MLFSKCLRAKIYCNMNVHFDPQGCQTLLLKESELLFLPLGSWTNNLNYPKSPAMGFFSKGLENEFETAVVNEPSLFEPLKFYCIMETTEACLNSSYSANSR